MRLYGSSATTSKSARRHARANRPVAAFDAPSAATRRRSEPLATERSATTPVRNLIPRSV